jgi:ketosteroid isomerase-like protein
MKATAAVVAAIVAVLALLYVASSPNAPVEMTDAEIAQHEAEVMQAIDAQWAGYREAMVAGDAEGVLSRWTDDMRLWGPGLDLGRAEFESLVRGSLGSDMVFTAFDFTPFDTSIHGNVVYQIGRMDVTGPGPDGEPVQDHSYALAKWVKQPDGVWRMSRGLQGPVGAPDEG